MLIPLIEVCFLFQKENINLENVKGTGPNGKITKEDLIDIKKDISEPIEEIINLDDKKIFNGIVKKDDIEEVKKISGIISIL